MMDVPRARIYDADASGNEVVNVVMMKIFNNNNSNKIILAGIAYFIFF